MISLSVTIGPMTDNPITDSEVVELVHLLKKLTPGFYPIEIFWEFCRLVKTTAVEIIPFVKDELGNVKVVLIKRSKDDKFWPNQYHTPGCVVRPEDNLDDTIERVIVKELKSPNVLVQPQFVNLLFAKTKRGNSIHLLYWVQLDKIIPEGELFEVDCLPLNLVDFQDELIAKALDNFKAFSDKEK